MALIKANFPRSQLCSNCGEKNNKVKDLSIVYEVFGGDIFDRDENAAKNILREGKCLLTVGQTGIA